MVQKYWKAAIAGLGVLATGIATTAADPEIAAVLPQDARTWLVVVAGGAVTTAITFLKRNEQTVAEAEEALARAKARVSVGNQPQ